MSAAAFLDIAFMPGHVLAYLWSSIIHRPILLIKVLAAVFVEIWFVAVYRDLMESSLAVGTFNRLSGADSSW